MVSLIQHNTAIYIYHLCHCNLQDKLPCMSSPGKQLPMNCFLMCLNYPAHPPSQTEGTPMINPMNLEYVELKDIVTLCQR